MKQFLKQHKYFILAFLIFVILAIVSGYQTLKISNFKFQISNQIQNSNTNTTTSPNHLITSSLSNNTEIIQPLNNSTPTSTLIAPTLPSQTETSKLEPTSYKLEAVATSTVYELMKNSQLDFKTKTFSGLGEFVEEINGIKNDNQASKYWIYYINGESAKLGVSQQIIKPNDIITWKYENANF